MTCHNSWVILKKCHSVAQQPVGIVLSENRKVAHEFLLSCSRAPKFLFPLVFSGARIFFSNRCFHAPDFPFPPSCSRTPKLLSPWCSRAPESLLSNRCYRALDFRLSPSPRSRAPCLLLFSSSFWAPYFPLFPLVFLRP